MKWNVVTLDEKDEKIGMVEIEADTTSEAMVIFVRDHPEKYKAASSYMVMEEVPSTGMAPDESIALLGEVWDIFRRMAYDPEKYPEWKDMVTDARIAWTYYLREEYGEVLEWIIGTTLKIDRQVRGQRN